MRPIVCTLLSAVSLLQIATLSSAADWLNWRGPNYNGSTTETGFPATFSLEENLAWSAQLPGEGASTPIVVGDAIFLTSVDEATNRVVAICLDSKEGTIRWMEPYSEEIRRDERSTCAGPSAVSDGEKVFFFSGDGHLVAFDLAGTKLWARDIEADYGDFAYQWTYSSSPQLYDGILYVQVLQRNEPVNGRGRTDAPIDSYLLAMEPATGKTLWSHVRPSDALLESREAFSTPIPITHNGRTDLVISGGDALTGHDPATGKEIWRWGTYNPEKIGHWRLVPSPVYGEGTILICGPKTAPVYAITAGGEGTLPPAANLWTSEGKEVTSDVPTPLYYEGYFYVLNGNNRFLSCVHPGSGKVMWTQRFEGKVKLEASPTGADGRIYLLSHLGEVSVFSAGPQGGQLLHSATFASEQSVNIRASIVPANKTLYIRTDNQLHAVR